MKKILVTLDGSPHGEVATEYGLALGKAFGCPVNGLHVIDARVLEGPLMADLSGWVGATPYAAHLPRFREMFEEKGRTILRAFKERIERDKHDGDILLRTGYPARVIRELEDGYDLVVLGRQGEHEELVGHTLGSTVDRVIRHTEQPCLVTARTYHPVSKILAAYDGSPHARDALQVATEWAKTLGIELIVLSVAEHGTEKANARASEGQKAAAEKGVAAAALVAEGRQQGPAVIESAEEQGCSLIVVGAFGHSRLRELIVGSTTAYVLNHSATPVLVVR